jgi:hypothetical protein
VSGSLKAANRCRTNGSTSGRELQRPGRVIKLKRTGLAPTTASIPCALRLRRQFLANGRGRITDLVYRLLKALLCYSEGMRPVSDLVVRMHVDLAAVCSIPPHLPDERSRTASTVRKTPTICARSRNRNEGHVPTLEPKREKRDGPSDPVFALRQEIGLDTKRKRENRT